MHLNNYKFLVCGYGLPAEIGISTLFGYGCKPQNIRLLTHENDSRNAGLLSLAKLRNIDYRTSHPREPETIEFVQKFAPDILISLHFRLRISSMILGAVKIGAFNLHPSLLPSYRGTNSVSWALINGENETGFSYHYLDDDFDTGKIILQKSFAITDSDTSFSLFHKQIILALPLLGEVIKSILNQEPGLEQKGEVSYFPRKLPFDGLIEPTWSLSKIDRFIRAMYFPPFEPARIVINGNVVLINDLQEYIRVSKYYGIKIHN